MKINGTWFEFQHSGPWEAPYWNPCLQKFTREQWVAMLTDIAGLGMEYLVLMSSALYCKTFYKSKHFESYDMATEDPMQVLFETADKLGLKIFVANDYFGDWVNVEKMFSDPEIKRLREIATEEIVARFGHHPSFYGWYWPNELDICPYYSKLFIQHVKENKQMVERYAPGKKILIAPYGTFHLITDDQFCRDLEELDVDFVAYQDEIGVRKANVEWTPAYFERLKKAHDKVGRSQLWADVEVFKFEGAIYKTALLPASFELIQKQLAAVEPFVEKILIYQYPGMMSRPGSIAVTDNPDSQKLYTDYANFLKTL